MAINRDQFRIDQMTRVLNSMGWTVVATDLTGPNLRIVIEQPKEVQSIPPPTTGTSITPPPGPRR